MTGEEMESAMAFILEQQAQLTATVSRLGERMDGLGERMDELTIKVDRTAGSIINLLAVAEIQAAEIRDLTESTRTLVEHQRALADRQRESEERGRRTDERLDALINIVERHISEGRNGKA